MRGGFTYPTSYTLTPGQPPPGMDYLPASPHHSPTTTLDQRLHHSPQLRRDQGGFTDLASPASALAPHSGYGNINPLSIDYACRPRLRPRLTLGGTTWPRNPWSTGASDSHAGCRYSCLHSHSSTVHNYLPVLLHPADDAPLPITASVGSTCCNDTTSAVRLSPATLSARNH